MRKFTQEKKTTNVWTVGEHLLIQVPVEVTAESIQERNLTNAQSVINVFDFKLERNHINVWSVGNVLPNLQHFGCTPDITQESGLTSVQSVRNLFISIPEINLLTINQQDRNCLQKVQELLHSKLSRETRLASVRNGV
uniref:Uncharacterized protein n=1 Tax=Laticauda laticaudata TaxID=8630 RepID=A0A8C5S1P9_LATLA